MPKAQIDTTHVGLIGCGAVVNMANKGTVGQTMYPPAQVSMTPAAANATYYLNAQSANGTTVSVNKKPDYPRNVQIVASGATTANVVITGLDTNGYQVTETLALNGTTPVVGKKSYSEVLTVAVPTVASTTVSVGTDVSFGLAFRATAVTVFLATVDGAADTGLGTFAIGSTSAGTDYYGTWSPATAPNGTHAFVMFYIPTDLASYGVNN